MPNRPRIDSLDTRSLAAIGDRASFIMPLVAYIVTLAPTVTLEDSGSFITVARWLGVAHPPGFPLWCLISHAFTWLPVGNIAVRVHMSSAVFAALACWLVYRIALRRTGSVPASLAAALTLGFSATLWSQAVIAEVYTLNTLFAALLILLAVRWQEDGSPRWLYALGLASGLAMTAHTMIILVLAPVWLWCLTSWRRHKISWHTLFIAVGLGLLGLMVYFYLPLRAKADPVVNWHDPETFSQVIQHIRRAAYMTPTEQARYLGQIQAVFGLTIDSWWQSLQSITLPMAAVAAAGVVALWRSSRGFALLILALFFLHTFIFNAYVHAVDTPLWRFVHRVYYIPAQLALAIAVAPGLVWLTGFLKWPDTVARRTGLSVVVGGWLIVMGIQHADSAGLRGDRLGEHFGMDIISTLPQDAGILPMGDMVVFTALYLTEVEAIRPDVKILSPSFGWQGEPVSTVFAIHPLSAAVKKAFPWCENLRAVPWGLGYLYVQPAQVGAVEFRLLAKPPAPNDLQMKNFDPFREAIRTTYGGYFARAGDWALAQSDTTQALAWLDRAEILGADDPYVLYATAQAYRRGQIRQNRIAALLDRALEQYDVVDASADRYYAVSLTEIEELRAKLP